MADVEEGERCPDCGNPLLDYNGIPVCEVCYQKAIDQMNDEGGKDDPFSGTFPPVERRAWLDFVWLDGDEGGEDGGEG